MFKLLQYLTIFMLGIYILYLYSINKINFLVNDRYIYLTLATGIILTLIGGISVFKSIKSKEYIIKNNYIKSLLLLILITVLALVPLRSLSTESFNIRSVSKDFQVTDAEKANISNRIKFEVDSTKFSIYDWIKAKGLKDNSLFQNKEFEGIGFVTPYDDKHFTISRFIVSCCVVDATPVGLIAEGDYKGLYNANDWVKVKGKFDVKELSGTVQPIIIVKNIEKIPEPKDIYLNR
jgi:uncharacterized repeat protein (TIGR03943 family)